MATLDEDDAPMLASDLLRAWRDDDPEAEAAVLARAEEIGDGVVPDIAATFSLARDLPASVANDLRDAGEMLAFAADVDRGYELLLRDVAQRPPSEVIPDLEGLCEVLGERDWTDVALPLREEAVENDDEMLRQACSYMLAYSAPGEPGVLEALLDEYTRNERRGLSDLCSHRDDRAAPVLLDWLREIDDVTALDADAKALACDVAVALSDWGTKLEPADRARADAAILDMCKQLQSSVDELREEIGFREELIEDLRSRIPGTRSHRTAHGKIGRNAPCPCGSGRKAKRCCG